MVAEDQRFKELEDRVTAVEKRRTGPAAGPEQCSAEFPHANMSYSSGLYRCPCGQHYRKDGSGGLLEVQR